MKLRKSVKRFSNEVVEESGASPTGKLELFWDEEFVWREDTPLPIGPDDRSVGRQDVSYPRKNSWVEVPNCTVNSEIRYTHHENSLVLRDSQDLAHGPRRVRKKMDHPNHRDEIKGGVAGGDVGHISPDYLRVFEVLFRHPEVSLGKIDKRGTMKERFDGSGDAPKASSKVKVGFSGFDPSSQDSRLRLGLDPLGIPQTRIIVLLETVEPWECTRIRTWPFRHGKIPTMTGIGA